jgi:hypothetical protein
MVIGKEDLENSSKGALRSFGFEHQAYFTFALFNHPVLIFC